MKVERDQGYTNSQPGYGQLSIYRGNPILIMGNAVKTKAGGVQWVWAADWHSGERIDAELAELSQGDPEHQPSLLEVLDRVEAWARNGNADAMWWLGDFHEFGSRATGANGAKALAYYLGAIRCMPQWYDEDTVRRILIDGSKLFRAGHPEEVADHTPVDALAVLRRFEEYRDVETKCLIHFPASTNWNQCIEVAESFNAQPGSK